MNKSSILKKKSEQSIECPSINNGSQYVTVHIEPHNSISFKVLLNIYGNVYSQIQKYIVDDIIVIIFGEACKTTQTFHELFYKYGTTEFRAEVYRFTDFNDILKDLRQLITDLAQKDFDENICSQIKKIQSGIQIKESISFQSQIKIKPGIKPGIKTTTQKELQAENVQRNDQVPYNIQSKSFDLDEHISSRVNFSKFASELIEVKTTCYYCQQQISGNTIQISCGHHYHFDCLESLMQSQLAQRKSNIFCMCNIKIKLTINLFGTGHQQEISTYHQQLLINQLQIIKTNLGDQAISCNNKACHYFYIYDNKYDKTSKCPEDHNSK